MFKIKEVSDFEIQLGGRMDKLLPAMSSIPEEFKSRNTKWNDIVSKWFYGGFKNPKFTPKKDVDTNKAIRHLKAILVSYEPKHEHKEAGVAFLLSQWFEDITYEKG
jgi:hypothetical protein